MSEEARVHTKFQIRAGRLKTLKYSYIACLSIQYVLTLVSKWSTSKMFRLTIHPLPLLPPTQVTAHNLLRKSFI